MDNKSELFNLEREKRELDAFLSTIAGDEASTPLPARDVAQVKETLSSSAQDKSWLQTPVYEPDTFKAETPAVKTEEPPRPSIPKDKASTTSVNEFIPSYVTDNASIDFGRDASSSLDRSSSLFSLDDEKKPTAPRVIVSPAVKPLESFKTMTRFDGTTKYDGPSLTEAFLKEEKKTPVKVEAEKKTEKTGAPDLPTDMKLDKKDAYDFAPKKKGIGKAKWIGMFILLILLLLAGYFWFSSKSSGPGAGSFFKTDWSVPGSSVKEITLLNVRQRLVYNVKLGRSVRVVEGIAENSATYPVSKIKIVANLFNVDGSILATKESFGGNILIDKQLENLDESGLLFDLNRGKASEDLIPPKGQTPFMIIFTREMTGVHRLSVTPVDFIKH